MAAKVVAAISLRVGENKPYGFNLTTFCANYFSPGGRYALGEVVRPREIADGGRGPTGLEYIVTTAGQARDAEPTWPTSVGGTVTSGTVTFTAQAISNASLKKTILSSTWSGVAGVIAIDDDTTETSNGEQKTQAFLEALVVSDPVEVINEVTFSDGHIENYALKVKVIARQTTT